MEMLPLSVGHLARMESWRGESLGKEAGEMATGGSAQGAVLPESLTCVKHFDGLAHALSHNPHTNPVRAELLGNSLAVQWLGLLAFTVEGTGSIPGRGTKIPQSARHGQKKKDLSF